MNMLMLPLLVGLSTFSSQSFATDASVNITNSSMWLIHQMYISPTSQNEWGPDQLGDEVIPAQGGTFTLVGIPCGAYDVKLIDEDGDVCIVQNVPMCDSNEDVNITDEALLTCQNN